MKNIGIVLAAVACAVLAWLGVFVFFFGFGGLTFDSRVRQIRSEIMQLNDEQLRTIVRESARLSDEVVSRKLYEMRCAPGTERDIPQNLQFLHPELIVISDGDVFFYLAKMMDSGAFIKVQRHEKDHAWTVSGTFGEPGNVPDELLWPKAGSSTTD